MKKLFEVIIGIMYIVIFGYVLYDHVTTAIEIDTLKVLLDIGLILIGIYYIFKPKDKTS